MGPHHAIIEQHAEIQNGNLLVSYANGSRRHFPLPDRSDKAGIKAVRKEASAFAESNGASQGQINAIFKSLIRSVT